MLRFVGRQSFSKFVGDTIGGREDIWCKIRSSKSRRDAALLHVLTYELDAASPAEAEKVRAHGAQLLDPAGLAIGLDLLQVVAHELRNLGANGQEGLCACWAW